MLLKNYHVQHILVKAQYEALDLLKKLEEGSNFEVLAKKFSTCPSAPCGGDLGVLKMGQADGDFEEAVLKLKLGEISSQPVRTKFGYHLLKRIA